MSHINNYLPDGLMSSCGWGCGSCCCCFWGSHRGQITESALKFPSSSSKTRPQRTWIRPLQPGQNFRNSCVGARQLLASKQGPIGNDGIMPSCAPAQKKQQKWGSGSTAGTTASKPASSKTVNGTSIYTKPDWPGHLTAYFVSDSVWNLKVNPDHLSSYLSKFLRGPNL